MDRTTLESYALVLVQEDLRAFQVAVAIISESKREPGETAFPELGAILKLIMFAEESGIRECSDPPADRKPIYAGHPGTLTNDQLRLEWKAEITALEKQVRDAHPRIPPIMLRYRDHLPEPQCSRYTDLKMWAADWRTYPLQETAALESSQTRPLALPLGEQ